MAICGINIFIQIVIITVILQNSRIVVEGRSLEETVESSVVFSEATPFLTEEYETPLNSSVSTVQEDKSTTLTVTPLSENEILSSTESKENDIEETLSSISADDTDVMKITKHLDIETTKATNIIENHTDHENSNLTEIHTFDYSIATEDYMVSNQNIVATSENINETFFDNHTTLDESYTGPSNVDDTTKAVKTINMLGLPKMSVVGIVIGCLIGVSILSTCVIYSVRRTKRVDTKKRMLKLSSLNDSDFED